MILFRNSVTLLVRRTACYNSLRYDHSGGLVRVRFAPSPTGFLHLGGLRTALYNYLFAKKANGRFILRIEDTDQTRRVKGAAEKIIEDLSWAGIEIDEGPNIGGKYGPYVQSERLDLYRTEVKKLLENGNAYYCFCTERRLELLRKEALRTRQVPKYDNKCRHLTPVQIAEKLTNNKEFCIRFKLESYTEPIDDLVYGKVAYDVAENEGDPVIIKSDGFPTYHFANVVDDHFMNITHVLRGVEWQISTTKHLLLYKAFGWRPPKFGHLPLLINADGTKLSKRQGDIHISHYRDSGILPQALVNYVTQAGGGFIRQQGLKPKSYTMNELSSQFDVSVINSHPSKLNPDLLDQCNRLEIIRQLNDPKGYQKLVSEVINLVKQKYGKKETELDLDVNHVKNILQTTACRISSIQELVGKKLSFLWILPKTEIGDLPKETLDELLKGLEQQEFNKTPINKFLKDFASKEQLKFSTFMRSLRSILSGLDEGPAVAEMMELLGKDVTLRRIRGASNKK